MNLSALLARFSSPFTAYRHRPQRKPRQQQRNRWSAELLETRVMLSASGITIDGNFGDWASLPSYTDPADDQHDTDHDGQFDTPSYVDHPDVDLLEYKVTHDEENFYFYFRASGEIGATQQENSALGKRAGRYYVIVTIDVDNDDSTGYWLHEGGYYPTTDGYDMNAELEFYNGSINTGHYLLHAALNDTELEGDFADQSNGQYVWNGPQTQGPFDPGFVELKSGDYDHYTQWVYKRDDAGNGGNDSVTFVQDKGPVVTGIIEFAQSPDGTELEMIAPFEGFLVDQFGNSIVELGKTVDLSFSLEASGELSNEVTPSRPNGLWASDTGEPINGYILSSIADLSIAKSNAPESVAQGEAIGYTLTVTNNGPFEVNGATVADDFSDQLENVAWTAVFAGGATGNASGSGDINELVNLPDGATVTYTITGTVKEDARLFLSNRATVTAPAGVIDNDLTNNSDYDIDAITITTTPSLGEFVEGDIAPGVNNGDYVKEVSFGDLNGDGYDDAVFAFVYAGHQIWLYDPVQGLLVDSGQRLAVEPNPAGAHHALGTEIADFNNDGYLDILVMVKSTQAVYLNDGTGQFSTPLDITGISSLEAYEVEVGDLDGDGDIDVIVADDDGLGFGGTGNNLLLFNDGTGQFPQITSLPSSTTDDDTWDTTVGDFNGDGSVDLVFANFSSGQTSELWFNDGAGNFTKSAQNFSGNRHWNVEKGDFDNDGDLDLLLVVNNGNPDYVELWNNDGSGNFSYSGQRTFTNENGQGGIEGIQIGDLDGDGDLDAFFSTFGAIGTIQTWENNGSGVFSTGFVKTFVTPTPPETAGGWRSRIGDVDGDGDLDAFVFEGNSEQVYYFENINEYPSALPYGDNFDDGIANDLAFVGADRWSVVDVSGDKSLRFQGRYGFGLGVAYLDTELPMPEQYEVVAKVKAVNTTHAWHDGFIVFDYQGPNDFKYAGMFVGQNQFVIGHFQGDWSNRIAQFDLDDIGGTINANQEYTVFVRVDGDTATLLVDSIERLTGTFVGGINDGSAGVAGYNSWTLFDELEIATDVSYGKPVDLPYSEDFSDGVADNIYYNTPLYWGVVSPGGEKLLRLNTSYNDLLGIAHVPLDPATTPSQFTIAADIRSIPAPLGSQNGFIIFDYKHENDFKYAGYFAIDNEWVIGHYQGDWSNHLSVIDWDALGLSINAKQWYSLEVEIDGNIARLSVDDAFITQANFGVSLNQGPVGLAADTAFTWFDNFNINTSPSAISSLFANWDEESEDLLI